MKKVRTYLFATALTATALTVSAGAAPLTIMVGQGNAMPAIPGYQMASCDQNLSFPDGLNVFLPNCPELSWPGQTPGFPGGDTCPPGGDTCPPGGDTCSPGGDTWFPGGDTWFPGETPELPDGGQTPPGGDAVLSDYESEVARLVNVARQENGLQPLAASSELSHVARIKSQDMVDNHYFSHTSPTYGSPFDMLASFQISYQTAGENIAYGQRTPQEVVDTWMNSPGHRANILNAAYTQIGVGYVANGNYWTQLFTG